MVGSSVIHGGAPDTSNVGVGSPVAVTWKLKEWAEDGTVSESGEVITGVVCALAGGARAKTTATAAHATRHPSPPDRAVIAQFDSVLEKPAGPAVDLLPVIRGRPQLCDD